MRIPAYAYVLAGALTLAGAFTLSADEWNRLTKVTFSGPVEVPGKVLPAGTYVFKLLDEPSTRNIVLIYDQSEKHLEDMVLAVSDQRLRRTGKSVIQFKEEPAGSPVALKAWFYAGSHYGEEFVYPHDQAVKLARANHQTVYSTDSDLTPYQSKELKSGNDPDAVQMKHSHVKTVTPDGQETDAPAQ